MKKNERGRATTRNRNNCDAKNVGERCVVVDHLSLMHRMLHSENSKIKFKAITFRDTHNGTLR